MRVGKQERPRRVYFRVAEGINSGINAVYGGVEPLNEELAGITVSVGIDSWVVVNPGGPPGVESQVGEVEILVVCIGVTGEVGNVVLIRVKVLPADVGKRDRQSLVRAYIERAERKEVPGVVAVGEIGRLALVGVQPQAIVGLFDAGVDLVVIELLVAQGVILVAVTLRRSQPAGAEIAHRLFQPTDKRSFPGTKVQIGIAVADPPIEADIKGISFRRCTHNAGSRDIGAGMLLAVREKHSQVAVVVGDPGDGHRLNSFYGTVTGRIGGKKTADIIGEALSVFQVKTHIGIHVDAHVNFLQRLSPDVPDLVVKQDEVLSVGVGPGKGGLGNLDIERCVRSAADQVGVDTFRERIGVDGDIVLFGYRVFILRFGGVGD